MIMVAFANNDCSGSPISTAVLGVTKTCYAFSYSLADEPAESFYSTSTEFSCSIGDYTLTLIHSISTPHHSISAQSNTCRHTSSHQFTLSTHRTDLSLPSCLPLPPSDSPPELLGYDVQKLFLSSDDSAVDTCNDYDLNVADGQIFEAFPTSTCIVQQQVG